VNHGWTVQRFAIGSALAQMRRRCACRYLASCSSTRAVDLDGRVRARCDAAGLDLRLAAVAATGCGKVRFGALLCRVCAGPPRAFEVLLIPLKTCDGAIWSSALPANGELEGTGF